MGLLRMLTLVPFLAGAFMLEEGPGATGGDTTGGGGGSDTTTGGGGEDTTGGGSGADTVAGGGGEDTPAGGGGEGLKRAEDMKEDELRQSLISTRTEAKNYRTELQEVKKTLETVQADLKKRQDAEKSDLERAQAAEKEAKEKAEAAETALRDERAKTAIMTEADSQKAKDRDMVYALVSKSSIKFDDDGKVTNAKELVQAVLKEKPLLAPSSTSSPAASGGGIKPEDATPGRGRVAAAYASSAKE